jgi:hypothetical protein
LKIPNTKIATAAKQAAYAIGIVAVIYVKTAFSVGFISLANSASTFLFSKHLIVSAKRQAVVFLEHVIRRSSAVVCSPLLAVRCGVFEIFATPFVVARRHTRLAVDSVACDGVFALPEFAQRLCLLTARAVLRSTRQVEWCSLRHDIPLCVTALSYQHFTPLSSGGYNRGL